MSGFYDRPKRKELREWIAATLFLKRCKCLYFVVQLEPLLQTELNLSVPNLTVFSFAKVKCLTYVLHI